MTDSRKSKRSYRSPLRERQAAHTRERVLEASAELFSTRGFGGTTMTGIAREAQVSVESVHATGSKAVLLVEAFRTRYTGEGGWGSFLDVGSVQDIFAVTDPDEAVERIVDFMATGHARSARLLVELRTAAAAEPVVAEQWDELVKVKAEGWAATAEWMVGIGIIGDVSSDDLPHLAATLGTLLSAETYLHLSSDWEFDEEQYRAWVRQQVLSVAV